MAKSFDNVTTYVVLISIILGLIAGLVVLGNDAIENPNANLDNDSYIYIASLQSVQLNASDIPKEEIEQSIFGNANYSQGNPKDQALDFLYTKEKGVKIETFIKVIFFLPDYVVFELLRQPRGDWAWIMKIVSAFFDLMVLAAAIYYLRGVK